MTYRFYAYRIISRIRKTDEAEITAGDVPYRERGMLRTLWWQLVRWTAEGAGKECRGRIKDIHRVLVWGYVRRALIAGDMLVSL